MTIGQEGWIAADNGGRRGEKDQQRSRNRELQDKTTPPGFRHIVWSCRSGTEVVTYTFVNYK